MSLRPEDPRCTAEDLVSEEEERPFETIHLPIPPTLNKLYTYIPGGGKKLTPEAKAWRQACIFICRAAKIRTIAGRIELTKTIYRARAPKDPDAADGDRLGDIDAYDKIAHDSLTAGEAWLDDGQIKADHRYIDYDPEEPRMTLLVSGARRATLEEIKAARRRRQKEEEARDKGRKTKARNKAERSFEAARLVASKYSPASATTPPPFQNPVGVRGYERPLAASPTGRGVGRGGQNGDVGRTPTRSGPEAFARLDVLAQIATDQIARNAETSRALDRLGVPNSTGCSTHGRFACRVCASAVDLKSLATPNYRGGGK